MVGWHHRLNGHEFEHAPGDGEGQGSLACYSPWGRKESDMTESLNNNKQTQGKKLEVTVVVKLKQWFVRHDIVYLVQRAGKAGND